MLLWQLSMVQKTSPILVCRVNRLLSSVLESRSGQLPLSVRRLWVQQDQHLCVLRKLWEEVHIDKCGLSDRLFLQQMVS